MSADTYTEVTNESWFGRIGGAFKGIIFGGLLFLIAFPVLFLNEGRAVRRYRDLNEGRGNCVSTTPDNVDPANEGGLVHLTGKAETDDTLTDPVFGISDNAIALRRVVEMYQWDEERKTRKKKKLGGGKKTVTTYSYRKTWSTRHINSASFKDTQGHQNPEDMPYQNATYVAENVTVGAFSLSRSLIGKISSAQKLSVDRSTPIPSELTGQAKLSNGGFYIGTSPSSPQIGDTRVTFRVTKPTTVSLVSQQIGNTFEPYVAASGGTVELLQTGTHSADAMFDKAEKSNKLLTLAIRIGGFLLMFIGINLILRPLSVVADIVPFLGSLVGAGLGIISFLVAAALSLVTVAIAWVFYRPLLGVSILAVAITLIVLIVLRMKKAKAT